MSFDRCGCTYTSKYFNKSICITIEEILCLDLIYDELKDNFDGKFDEECPIECSSSFYKLSYSSKNFPTVSYATHLLKNQEVFNRSFEFNKSLTVEEVSKSVARVRIHPYDTRHMVVTEMAAITLIDLISNIGGLLGLFMGMSLLSFVEIFELIFLIFSEICYQKKK